MRNLLSVLSLCLLIQLGLATFFGGSSYYPQYGNQQGYQGYDPYCEPGYQQGGYYQQGQQVLPPIDIEIPVYVQVPTQQQPIIQQQPYYGGQYCPPGIYRDDLQSNDFDPNRLINDCETDLYGAYNGLDQEFTRTSQKMQRSFTDTDSLIRKRQTDIKTFANNDQFLRSGQNRGVNMNVLQNCLAQIDGFVRQNTQQNTQRGLQCIGQVRGKYESVIESAQWNLKHDRQESMVQNKADADRLRKCSQRKGEPCRGERKKIQDTVKGADAAAKQEIGKIQAAELEHRQQIDRCRQEIENSTQNLQNNAQNLAQRCMNGARTPF